MVTIRDREEAINSIHQLHPERTPADRFIRRLLLLGDVVDKNAVLGGRRSTTTAIVVSGIRCTITYLLIPIVAPSVWLLDTFSAPISITLSLLAIVMGVTGVRRFWIADHQTRWPYTVFMAVLLVLLSVAVASDVSTMVSA
ncbi:MAG: hypothetical protein ACT4OP_10525 [Actinomycetota bacterium]